MNQKGKFDPKKLHKLNDPDRLIDLHHELDTPSRTLAEAFRIMKPGAALFIVDWKKQPKPGGPPLNIRFTAGEVEKQLINAGFQNIVMDNGLEKHFLIAAQKE